MRKKIATCILISLMIVLLFISSMNVLGIDSPKINDSIGTVLATIPVGQGSDKIQIITDVEGGTPEGPQSISVNENGDIYILDSVQSQVFWVKKDGAIQETISIPFSVYPREIFVFKKQMYILDSNAVIYQVDLEGNLIKEYKLPEGMGSLRVYRIAERNNKIILITENYVEMELDNLPKEYNQDNYQKNNSYGFSNTEGKKLKASYEGFKNYKIRSDDGSINIPIQTEQAFGSAMIVGSDKSNNTYVVVEELADPCPVIATEVTLRSYDKKGNTNGIAKVPIDSFASYPNRYVEVTRSGQVYLMVPSKDYVKIYSIKLGKSHTSDLATIRDRINKKALEEMGTSALASYIGNPYSRLTVLTRCREMANYRWTWNPTKYDYYSNGTFRGTYDVRPAQLSASSTTSTFGIPYLWGGWDSLWCKSDGAPWSNFGASLTYYSTKGPIVGDVKSAGTILTGGKGSGIDCSGFVSAAAGTYSFSGSKPGTTDLYNNGKTVYDVVGNIGTFGSYSGVQPMDFFVKSGSHVLNYYYTKLDGTGFYSYESTVSLGNLYSGEKMQGAKLYVHKWSELSGYTHKTWWTKQAGDDFDKPFTSVGSYNCMQGQSQYFKFTYNGTTSKTVSVSAKPSTYRDVDLYIYNSSYSLIGSSASGFGVTDTVSWTASPGKTYYARVVGINDESISYTISKSW